MINCYARKTLLLLVCVVLTAVADFLFYSRPLGWTMGGYLLLLLIACLPFLTQTLKTSSGMVLGFFTVMSAAAMVIEPGTLAVMLGVGALVMLRMTAHAGWSEGYWVWLSRWLSFLVYGWGQWAKDIKNRQRGGSRITAILRFFRRWLIPVVLTCGFILLFRSANPVIENLLDQTWYWVRDHLFRFQLPDPPRLFLWLLFAIWVWALLRMDILKDMIESGWGKSPFSQPLNPAAALREPADYSPLVVRCLILFNIAFLFQNVLDVEYLWAGGKLPSGLTYAAYAHRGAYPLIATALLAGVFVLTCFAGNRDDRNWRTARILVCLWLTQNVFLVLSALLRLVKYVNIYSLSLLRVAALIWMGLVAVGIVLIIIRIVLRKSNLWLIHANVISTALVLLACSFCNLRGIVADYNVEHCREIDASPESGPARASLDVRYLRSLGPEALPAIAWLRRSHLKRFSPAQENELKIAWSDLCSELNDETNNWRGWTWRRQQLMKITEKH